MAAINTNAAKNIHNKAARTLVGEASKLFAEVAVLDQVDSRSLPCDDSLYIGAHMIR